MKKMFSLVLALVLVLGCLPFQAFAEEAAPCDHAASTDGGVYHDAGDGLQHFRICSVCNNWFAYAEHSGGTATCIAKAKCSACNAEYGTTANNHVRTELRNAVTATCGNAGYTGDTYCLDCGTTVGTGTATAATTNHTPADSTYGKDATQHWQVCANGGHYYGYAAHTWTAASCSAAKTCSVCGYVDGTPSAHTWINATCTAAKKCGVCGLTEGTSAGHTWVAATCTAAKFCSVCGATEGSELGHSWSNNVCTRCGITFTAVDKYTISFNPNYNTAASTTLTVAAGTQINGLYNPTARVGYTFRGWYKDVATTMPVGATETVNGNATYYAKWTQDVPHEVYVKFYINGNTSSVHKYVDLYEYAQDGVITLDDLRSAANQYIKANNNAGLSVYGPFNSEQWERYCLDDYYRNTTQKISVNGNEKTVIYAMVHNAKIGGSSSTSSNKNVADSTNPKTGDMIFAPVAVMGLSVSALAVLFYLNKKRAY